MRNKLLQNFGKCILGVLVLVAGIGANANGMNQQVNTPADSGMTLNSQGFFFDITRIDGTTQRHLVQPFFLEETVATDPDPADQSGWTTVVTYPDPADQSGWTNAGFEPDEIEPGGDRLTLSKILTYLGWDKLKSRHDDAPLQSTRPTGEICHVENFDSDFRFLGMDEQKVGYVLKNFETNFIFLGVSGTDADQLKETAEKIQEAARNEELFKLRSRSWKNNKALPPLIKRWRLLVGLTVFQGKRFIFDYFCRATKLKPFMNRRTFKKSAEGSTMLVTLMLQYFALAGDTTKTRLVAFEPEGLLQETDLLPSITAK